MLNKEIQKQHAGLSAGGARGELNPSLKIQYSGIYAALSQPAERDGEAVRRRHIREREGAGRRGAGPHDEEGGGRAEQHNGNAQAPRVPDGAKALKSVMPLGTDRLNVARGMPTSALSACFPFTSSFLDVHNDGVMFGLNMRSGGTL
jgi:hypothetical protein